MTVTVTMTMWSICICSRVVVVHMRSDPVLRNTRNVVWGLVSLMKRSNMNNKWWCFLGVHEFETYGATYVQTDYGCAWYRYHLRCKCCGKMKSKNMR